MKNSMRILTAGILFGVTIMAQTTARAIPFTFEGRSLGMGGVAVATADIATAAFANPAMLTNQLPTDDFALLIGVGGFLRDPDNMIDDIDQFQSANSRRETAINNGDVVAEGQALLDMAEVVTQLEGKVIAPELTAAAAMGITFDSFSLAISARADAIAGGAVTNLSCSPGQDLVSCAAAIKTDLNNPNKNLLNIDGIIATEVGLSLATDFDLLGQKLSVGLKPKLVNLQGLIFKESIQTVSAGFDSINKKDNKFDLGNFTTLDLGLSYDITDSFRLGLIARNLITEQFKVLGQTLNFDREYRLGLAYHNRFLTLGLDYDLSENQPLLANPVFDKLKTQYLQVGAELNAFDYVQLRVGAAKNLASGIDSGSQETAYTAGLGIWLGFNLDVAATYTQDSLGAYVQTGFRF